MTIYAHHLHQPTFHHKHEGSTALHNDFFFMFFALICLKELNSISLSASVNLYTEDPRYNDNVTKDFAVKSEFAVIKKLDMDPYKA